MEYEILTYIGTSISWLIQLLILIACIILVIKNKSIHFKMMLFGTILTILFSLTSTILFVVQSHNFNMDQILFYNGLIGIIKAIVYSLFGLGLLLFALNIKKQRV